jgi:uncharacterized protein with HEPN domain
MRRDLAYLEDIVEASDAIADFIRDQDMASFPSNPKLKSALAHEFTIIGEAVARVAWDEVWRTATLFPDSNATLEA